MIKLDLLNYKEFGAGDAPSIRGSFEPKPYPGMERIIRYLEGGKPHLFSPQFGVDAISGERVADSYMICGDGEYSWSSMLPYYVRKYNMRLPAEFEAKVLRLSA